MFPHTFSDSHRSGSILPNLPTENICWKSSSNFLSQIPAAIPESTDPIRQSFSINQRPRSHRKKQLFSNISMLFPDPVYSRFREDNSNRVQKSRAHDLSVPVSAIIGIRLPNHFLFRKAKEVPAGNLNHNVYRSSELIPAVPDESPALYRKKKRSAVTAQNDGVYPTFYFDSKAA